MHVERLIGSIRRECLDHMIVFGEAHLRRIVGAYTAYYNEARTHRSLNKDAPSGAPLSVSAQSRHNRFSAAFAIDIAESNFRYRQPQPSRPTNLIVDALTFVSAGNESANC
jgi:Integrase core domain